MPKDGALRLNIKKGEPDLRPVIFYDANGSPKAVKTFCHVNMSTVSESTYGVTPCGGFYETHFDEHHGIGPRPTRCGRERLENMKSSLPILEILEASSRDEVERLVADAGQEVRHM
ncbi:MAG: hypothetical protein KKH88_04995 [Nanoarchaeota archaeon]|nr:hypothetical protein [Nanoarchaeota archaeon]MBU1444784.1 hypothetical protein [Nanoarchaeota archaeon]MBU2406546.1 hypothetical protein [Nanoarchaeota archaeon]MBU2420268.1 hypothetical protein [Nanoarchaeota archaeon]MBU2475033.1 hypothetical protein [Nanoarchaeota archaeon]